MNDSILKLKAGRRYESSAITNAVLTRFEQDLERNRTQRNLDSRGTALRLRNANRTDDIRWIG